MFLLEFQRSLMIKILRMLCLQGLHGLIFITMVHDSNSHTYRGGYRSSSWLMHSDLGPNYICITTGCLQAEFKLLWKMCYYNAYNFR